MLKNSLQKIVTFKHSFLNSHLNLFLFQTDIQPHFHF